jgi:glc operon protein GlcG
MPASPASTIAQQIVDEVARLFPVFLEDPIDREMSKGNAAVCVLDAHGEFHGRILGTDKAKARWCFGIANRKVIQVWSTGYATGRFEQLVYAGKVDDTQFGINRPDFIGWEGGVPLVLDDGSFMAAAFSGIRGVNDVAIIVRAVQAVPGVSVKT